ncbi:MAG: efflux RND transporter permease subunit [Acidobacteria bacterium]|nr:efflux RND transporter permease subunit [Acidobacteriota bacterium]
MTPKLSRFEETLPRFSLGRRVSVLVLMASLVVVGVISTFGIPLELIPAGFSPPFLAVQVPWRDAPPEEVLEKIVRPLEEELSTVRGLDSQFSMSRTGFGRVFMNFKNGTDMDVAYREVRDRVERARVRLPSDADRIFIRKEDASSIPVYVLGLTYDPDMGDPYRLIQREVVMRIERLDGVASVEINGLQEPEIFIELDRGRTEASGLNIYQVAQDLGADNFTMASGDIRWGGRKLLLRSVARFTDLESIRNRQISPHIKLSDIATVEYKPPERKFRIRANSQPAVALIILKEGQANTIEVARRIQTEVDAMQERPRLQNIGMVPLFDQGAVILESLNTLLNAGKIGGLFAAIVLFFFLRRLRMTLIIALCIPLSLLAALAVMFFAGESLNILSLLGLMISVGLLVDNAVVVGENIHRLHREGLPRRQAAIQGAGEIALAVTTATLTTVIVFVPVSLVEGQGQFFLMRLALPICVALLASLAIAGVFVPLSVYLTLKNGRTNDGRIRAGYDRFTAALANVYDATLGRLNDSYTRLLGFFLDRRLDLLVVCLVIFAATMGVAQKQIKVVDMQEEERSGFEIDVRMPQGMTLSETEDFFLQCESTIEDLQEELGLSGWFLWHTASHGELQGFFESPRTVKISPREATEKVLDTLPKKPGVRYFTGSESQQGDEGKDVAVVTLWGEDAGILEETAENLETIFAAIPGVLGLKSSADPPPNEIGLIVDRERAQQQQINPQVVAGVVGYALRGQQLARYRTGGEDIPVRVRFREEDRENLNQLKGFYVPTGQGGFAPLSSVTKVEHLQGVRHIFRRDKRTQRTLTLELEEGREEEARRRIEAVQHQLDLPEGVRFGDQMGRVRPGGGGEDMEGMKFAIALSIVFIYLLMGFLFESAILPLSIITTIPLAGIGVVWAHLATGYDLDGLGVVGIVLLVGVVVNNGIVLVDYTNRLREAGTPRRDALLLAAERRFRPIMMTAMTTICGMIPVTLSGASSIGLSYTSFGLTLIGGLTTATLLTLLVVPVFYTFFEDLGEMSAGLVKRAWQGRGAAGADMSPT